MKFGNKGQDLGGAFGLCVKLLDRGNSSWLMSFL